MIETLNLIIGLAIILINLLPFVFKEYKYLLVTGLLSVLLSLMLISLG